MKSYRWFNCRGHGKKKPKCAPILKKVFSAFSYFAGGFQSSSVFFWICCQISILIDRTITFNYFCLIKPKSFHENWSLDYEYKYTQFCNLIRCSCILFTRKIITKNVLKNNKKCLFRIIVLYVPVSFILIMFYWSVVEI